VADGAPTVTGDVTADRLAALHAYTRITQAFSAGFDESESRAYGSLLKDMMDYGGLLISGGLMSAKEHLDKLEDLQQHVHKSGTGGRSVADEFHDWFNSEAS